MQPGKKSNVIKASNKLQLKAGFGKPDENKVTNSQKVIETNEVDFAPLGFAILEKLKAALENSRDASASMEQMKAALTAPVMELKANAGIFHYVLVGNLANIMLSFLESLKTLDKNAIEIVKAHHDTLHMIIARNMKGAGGAAGAQLETELKQACARYYKKLQQTV